MDEKDGHNFDQSAGYESLNQSTKRQGGFRASFFIFGLVALENMGFVANMVSMVLYFLLVMHLDLATSANTLTNFLGSTFLLSIVGGFISDTYLTRLNTCLVFGFLEIGALILVTIQAHFHKLQPDPCANSHCLHGANALMFYISLCFLALGYGGVKGTLPALGGDQFNHKHQKDSNKYLASFFSWLLLSTTIGAVIGVTVIVWVSMNKGWDSGFLIITLAASLGYIILALGKPYYRIVPPGEDSPILRLIQVIVVAFRNRKLMAPQSSAQLYETTTTITHEEGSFDEEKLPHTKQFGFLDKASIPRQDSSTTGPWKVCTVTQVEEVKILARMLPIIGSTILVNTCLAQLQTFSVQQGNVMDLHLGSFKVPAASIPVIPLLFITLLIPIYEFLFVPFARKITNHPSGITQLQRVGIGLFLSIISMSIAGFVEVKRRNRALQDPTKPISLFWLSFQFGIFGVADMFTVVGLLEFFYKEAPSGMRSLSTSFTYLSQSLGYFTSTILVDIINSITKKLSKNKLGWLQGQDLNNNNLDLFYWFLAILGFLNFVNYLFWASWYKYKSGSQETPRVELKERASDGSPFLKVEETIQRLQVNPASTCKSIAST
ncbi:hypothetical protein Syun_008238 [Stephania yunnanensis]|uniref:Uncharacterized protein n=1 Tax=Stephania yunnanensis TaxID=152371 RepID=A0AAP0L1N6_9MAGN